MKKHKIPVAAVVLLIAGLILANGTALLSDRMPMPEVIRWSVIGLGIVLMIIALMVQKRSKIADDNHDI